MFEFYKKIVKDKYHEFLVDVSSMLLEDKVKVIEKDIILEISEIDLNILEENVKNDLQ